MNERIKLDLEERPSSGVVEGIADSLADVGICSGEADTRGLHFSHYRHDSLVVVMREDHALAGREKVTFVETLDGDHVGLHAASSINLRTHMAARQAGKPLRLRIQVPGFDAVCRMVQTGLGISVLPLKVFNTVGRPLGLTAVTLDEPWSQRDLIVVVRDVSALSPVSKMLFDHLLSVEHKEQNPA
jgi:DNA-binding transcriptional LysR family regulator